MSPLALRRPRLHFQSNEALLRRHTLVRPTVLNKETDRLNVQGKDVRVEPRNCFISLRLCLNYKEAGMKSPYPTVVLRSCQLSAAAKANSSCSWLTRRLCDASFARKCFDRAVRAAKDIKHSKDVPRGYKRIPLHLIDRIKLV